MTGYLRTLGTSVPSCLEEGVDLAPMTSMGIGGSAHWLAEPRDLREMAEVLAWASARELPVLALGEGCNMLVREEGWPGLVLRFGRMNAVRMSGERVIAQAGASLPRLIRMTAGWGLSGLECLAGIPATVGGATAMNAGGRYGDFGDYVESVLVMDAAGRTRLVKGSDAGFAYRRSGLDGQYVCEVVLCLVPGDPQRIQDRARAILEEKRANQPMSQRSSGCIFKNPQGYSAGVLIDRAGLRGEREGAAQVSPRHANFIVNLGGARSGEVLALIKRVRRRVRDVHGVELETEVRIV